MEEEKKVDLDAAKMELMKAMAICELMTCLDYDGDISLSAVKALGFDLADKLKKVMVHAGMQS